MNIFTLIKKSHIYKHLQEPERCKELANADCFSILDYSKTTYRRKIKVALYIKWSKASLNKQVKSYNLTLLEVSIFFVSSNLLPH